MSSHPVKRSRHLLRFLLPAEDHDGRMSQAAFEEARRDAVCGRPVPAATAAVEVRHGGVRYDFCSTDCAERFLANPARYQQVPDAAR